MTEQRNQLADLFAACWKDEALKQRFMADPKAVLGPSAHSWPPAACPNALDAARTGCAFHPWNI